MQRVDLLAALAAPVGAFLVVLGLADVFLTVLHPDRDGPASLALNRGTWAVVIATADVFPRASRELVALAGGLMIAATIVLWTALPVLGFALLAWPFLDTHFTGAAPPSLATALYWSASTFTTLGYGDIVPATSLWRLLSVFEGLVGFALMGSAVAFLLSVFEGVKHRDKMALRMYSETRRSWDGVGFLLRVLRDEGPSGARRRLETWAEDTRDLHERLYRFQPLAFYVRTRSEKHEPERMLQALADIAVAGGILGQRPELGMLRSAAEEIDIAYAEFAHSAVRHHGSARALAGLDRPVPEARDLAHVDAIRRRINAELPAEQPGPTQGEQDEELHVLAARRRIFLEEIARITRWREIAPG